MAYDSSPWSGSLPVGTHRVCACGESKNKPYCDGSHATSDSGKTPSKLELTEETRMALCMCGKSENGPRCDGSHSSP